MNEAQAPATYEKGNPAPGAPHRSRSSGRVTQEWTKASTTSPAMTGRRAAAAGTVSVQARIDETFATELMEHDAPVLGLTTVSEMVREGLRLLHRHAREQAMADSYDNFYGGESAPVSEVTAALWAE